MGTVMEDSGHFTLLTGASSQGDAQQISLVCAVVAIGRLLQSGRWRDEMLESAREVDDVKPKVAHHQKKDINTWKYQLRIFGPWINRFGTSVFRRMVKAADDDENVAIVTNPLFILMAGLSEASADEDTTEACEALFGKVPSSFGKLANKMFKLNDDLVACKWTAVTSLFLPANRKLNKDFCEKMEDHFGVVVQKLASNDDSESIEAINTFIRNQSAYFTDIIPRDQEELEDHKSSMVATIGVYVHPWWRSRFNKQATTRERFYESEEESMKVQMMHHESTLPYVEGDLQAGMTVQIVGIPCVGRKVIVYFVLPKDRFSLPEVVSHLTGDRISRLIENCHPRRVRVSVPRIYTSFHAELREKFSSMGMHAWLNQKHPAFGRITRRGGAVSLGHIYHQVVLKVTEEGEEASVEEFQGNDAVDFKCNQPFLMLLHHKATNTIWMMIQVNQPNVQGPRPPLAESDSE